MAWCVLTLRLRKIPCFVYSEIPVNAAGEEDGVILSLVQDDKLGYIWLTTGHDFMSLQIQPDKTLKQLKFQTGLLPVNHMLVEVLKGRGMSMGVGL